MLLLSFYENGRPPLYQRQKQSKVRVNPRRPFDKHPAINYDEDTDTGDDVGTDSCSIGHGEKYEEDGWLIHEEAKADVTELLRIAISPFKGRPISVIPEKESASAYVQGMDEHSARQLIQSHFAIDLRELPSKVDVFPSENRRANRKLNRNHTTSLQQHLFRSYFAIKPKESTASTSGHADDAARRRLTT
jgi:hypothetical protein